MSEQTHDDQQDYIASLERQVDAETARADRAEGREKRLADDALQALAAAKVCTPEKGYVAEPHCLTADIGTLARQRDQAEAGCAEWRGIGHTAMDLLVELSSDRPGYDAEARARFTADAIARLLAWRQQP